MLNESMDKTSKKTVYKIATVTIGFVGLFCLLSAMGPQNASQSSQIAELSDAEARYAANMKTNHNVFGQLSDVLKATQLLALDNKRRLDALNNQANNGQSSINAQITLLNNQIIVLNNDVDLLINAPGLPGDSMIPYLMPDFELKTPTVLGKSKKLGSFNYAGNNQFIIDARFKLNKLLGGPTRCLFMIGDGTNVRLPAVYLSGAKGNELMIYTRTTDSVHTKMLFGPLKLIEGMTYNLRIESTGTALTSQLIGPDLDEVRSISKSGFRVIMPAGDQGVWMSAKSWNPVAATMLEFIVMQMY